MAHFEIEKCCLVLYYNHIFLFMNKTILLFKSIAFIVFSFTDLTINRLTELIQGHKL